MSKTAAVDVQQRQRALGGWEIESGAGPCCPLDLVASLDHHAQLPDMGKDELLTLHIRVVALQNMELALLAAALSQKLEIARDMPGFILSRPGASAPSNQNSSLRAYGQPR